MIFVLTICSLITFSACREEVILPSSAITLGMRMDNDGSITQELDFSFQTEKLKQLNVKANLIEECKGNLLSAVNIFRNEFYLTLLVTYSLNPNPLYKISEAVIVSQTCYYEKSDSIGFVIEYKDYNTWQFYQNGGKENNNIEESVKPQIKFFTQTSSQGKFPFALDFTQADESKTTIGERYLKAYKNAYNLTLPNQIVSSLEIPSFVYDYATPFANLDSNADLKVQSNHLYHNVWIKDINNFKDATIKLTSTVIYTGWWYLSLLLSVILIFGITLLIAKLVKIKRG